METIWCPYILDYVDDMRQHHVSCAFVTACSWVSTSSLFEFVNKLGKCHG